MTPLSRRDLIKAATASLTLGALPALRVSGGQDPLLFGGEEAVFGANGESRVMRPRLRARQCRRRRLGA